VNIFDRNDRYEQFSNERRQAEIEKCRGNFIYWLSRYGTILDATLGELVTFKPFPAQLDFINFLLNDKLIVCLKGRQLGYSWMVAHFCLWREIFNKHYRISVVSFTEVEAKIFMGKVFTAFDNLPTWMKPDVLNRRDVLLSFGKKVKTETGHIKLVGRLSWIMAFPCTKKFMRGWSPSLVIFDEADFIDDLEEMWPAVIGSRAQSRAQLIFITTANPMGMGGLIYQMYWEAGIPGKRFARFKKFFAGRDSDPRRDEEWLEENKDLLGERFRVEHPSTDAEAWLVNSQCFFDPKLLAEDIQYFTDHPTLPIFAGELIYNEKLEPGQEHFELKPCDRPWFFMWKKPDPEHLYCIGGDPGEGNNQSDDSVAYVLDDMTMELVAIIVGKMTQDAMAFMERAVGLYYNVAFIGNEANKGDSVNRYLTDPNECNYQNIYLRETVDDLNPLSSNKLGWYSSNQTKNLIYNRLDYYWRTRRLRHYDLNLLMEMQNIFNLGGLKIGTVKIGTRGNRPDNRPDAAALVLEMHFARPARTADIQSDFALKMQYREAKAKQSAMAKQGVMTMIGNPDYGEDPDEEAYIPRA
jgi:hypothetical protein